MALEMSVVLALIVLFFGVVIAEIGWQVWSKLRARIKKSDDKPYWTDLR